MTIDTLQFNNPVEISQTEFQDFLSLDFKPEDIKPENKEENKPDTKPEENKEEKPTPTLEEKVDTPPSLEINKTETKPEVINYTEVVNVLADKGIIEESYEGFNENQDADQETLIKLIEHNLDKKIEDGITDFLSNTSELTRRILEFDINSKDKKEITSFLKTLVEEDNIKSLDVSNEYDQEQILRQWYKHKEDFNDEEIDDKIRTFKEAGILEKEAKLVKPKLDQQAQKIAQEKEEEQRKFTEFESSLRANFSDRLIKTFNDKKSTIGSLGLSKEEAAQIHSLLTSDDVEITLYGNKKVKMSPLEATVLYNKFDKKGNIENLALATLLLINPEKFDKVYSSKAKKEETETFIKQHKYNNALKRAVS